MPQKRRFSKKPKAKPDAELERLKRMSANPFHWMAVRHGMRVPVLKMFCAVFVELAACAPWTKRHPAMSEMSGQAAYKRTFRCLCISARVNDVTEYGFFESCRSLWHAMMKLPGDRNARETAVLKQQLHEMWDRKASTRVIYGGIALASALHPRLGMDSPLAALGSDLLAMIANMLRPEGVILWVDVFAEFK